MKDNKNSPYWSHIERNGLEQEPLQANPDGLSDEQGISWQKGKPNKLTKWFMALMKNKKLLRATFTPKELYWLRHNFEIHSIVCTKIDSCTKTIKSVREKLEKLYEKSQNI